MLDNLSPLKEMPTIERDQLQDFCSVGTSELNGQATIRIQQHLWIRLQRPKRVDIFGPVNGEWTIKRGPGYSVQETGGGGAVQVNINAKRLGIHEASRPSHRAAAEVRGGKLVIAAMPAEWIGEAPSEAPQPAPEQSAEPQTIPLQNGNGHGYVDPHDWRAALKVSQADTHEPVEGSARMSVRKNNAGCTLNIGIPEELLQAIGSPTRCHIRGTVHEGLTIESAGYGDGLQVNVQGSIGWLTTGMANRGLTKEARRVIEVTAIAKDGVIKIAGPNYEWTRCANLWKPKKDQEAPPPQPHTLRPSIKPELGPGEASTMTLDTPAPMHVQIAAAIAPPAPVSFESPSVPAPIVNHFAKANSTNGSDVETLRALLKDALSDAGKLKAELEAKTGLKFKVTGDLKLVVMMD